MLTGPALDAIIPHLPSRPFAGVFVRATPLEFAKDPLGRNRPIVAQRFNVNGGARVLYLGDGPITSIREVQLFWWMQRSWAVVPIQFSLLAVVGLRGSP